MLAINNDSLNSYLPEISPTKAALVACVVAGAAFLGYKAYQYTQVAVKQQIREKIADYLVIGFTRDSKLSPEEKAIKGEAIAVRQRLITILTDIGKESIPGISDKKKVDLKNIITKLTLASQALDLFAPTLIKAGPLPTGWNVFETKIKSEILQRIQIKYSDDTSPEMTAKKVAQRDNLLKQIDTIYDKALAKNDESSPAKKFALMGAVLALKATL